MREFIQLVENASSEQKEETIWHHCLSSQQKTDLKMRTSRYHDADHERDARAVAYIASNLGEFENVFTTEDAEERAEKWQALLGNISDEPHSHTAVTERISDPRNREITRNIARGE